MSLADLAVAVSNSIGTFLCIVCMSYSLPFIPLAFLRAETPARRLQRLQYEISASKCLLGTLKNEFYNLVEKLVTLENTPGLDCLDAKHLDAIKKLVPAKYQQLAASNVKSGNVIVENTQVRFYNNF